MSNKYNAESCASNHCDTCECSICFREFPYGKPGTVQLGCRHVFCYTCLEKWVGVSCIRRDVRTPTTSTINDTVDQEQDNCSTCPNCRAPIPYVQRKLLDTMTRVREYDALAFKELGGMSVPAGFARMEVVLDLQESIHRALDDININCFYRGGNRNRNITSIDTSYLSIVHDEASPLEDVVSSLRRILLDINSAMYEREIEQARALKARSKLRRRFIRFAIPPPPFLGLCV
jgi:Ring finger domain